MFRFFKLLREIDDTIVDIERQVTKSPEETEPSPNKPQYQSQEPPSEEDNDTEELGYGGPEDVEKVNEQTGIQNTDTFNMGEKVPTPPIKSLASRRGKALINLSPYSGKKVKEKSQVSLPWIKTNS